MPGPFPGMDPYLEQVTRWYSVHNKMITYTEAAINLVLPPAYVANSETRCYISSAGGSILPDVAVVESSYPLPADTEQRSVAVLEAADPALTFRAYAQEETRETYINIFSVEDRSRVVTTIELLSHTNKTLHNKGRELYLAKQREVLASHTHLLEIDLLRAGKHTVAAPDTLFGPEHKYDYLISLHRAGRGREYSVWLNTIRERLPRVAVPLDPGVSDVTLDVQAVLNRTYEEGAYARKLDYMSQPAPPLTPDDTLWADCLLRERGLRS